MISAFSFRRASCGLFAALAVTMVAVAPARGQQPAAEGIVVLRNGNVLAGVVCRSGAYLRVEHAGSTLQVPVSQVEMACGSLTEAYELRRKARVGSSVDAHLELARWCLKHDLFDQAARELLDVRTSDPGHPALVTLGMQLRQGLENEERHRQQALHAKTAASDPPKVVEPASFDAPLLDPPTEAQSQFVRSIQPMLIHSCTTSGCHQPNSHQALQLDRWALEGSGKPALIRRNLEQVLAKIDKDDPPSSPLIRRARQAHGYRNEAMSTPLAPYQAALLLDWLNAAAGIEPEPQPGVETPAPAELATPTEDELIEAQLTDEAAQRLLAKHRPKPAFKPRDEFDPEIFNRAHAAKLWGPEEETQEETQIPATIESAIPATGQSPPTDQTAVPSTAD